MNLCVHLTQFTITFHFSELNVRNVIGMLKTKKAMLGQLSYILIHYVCQCVCLSVKPDLPNNMTVITTTF
jgi:hypothetical protein